MPPVLGPPLRALLSSHLHESLKGPTGGPTGTGATNGFKLNGPRGGVNAWRPSSQAIQVVPMAAISSSIAQTEKSPPRARDSRAALRSVFAALALDRKKLAPFRPSAVDFCCSRLAIGAAPERARAPASAR